MSGARAPVVAQVVVQRQLGDGAGLQQRDDLFGPADERPAFGRGAVVVQEDLHGLRDGYAVGGDALPGVPASIDTASVALADRRDGVVLIG